MKAIQNKMGFTLLELLIVILIIGLLSAISIPMYKKAVEKSKVADALSTMQAVSKSEHGWYLVRNNYTKDFANLDIDLYDKDGNKAEDESFDSINYTFTLQDNSIKAERNNGEYSLFKLYEDGNIYCIPEEHYICQQYNWKGVEFAPMNAERCNNINGAWANTTNTCYTNDEDRCKSLHGDSAWNGEFCGYTNTRGQTIGEGEFCYGDTLYSPIYVNGTVWNIRNAQNTACGASVIADGGECIPQMGGTTSIAPCSGVELKNGGICRGDTSRSCVFTTILTGGICYGNNEQTCSRSTIDGGECYAEGTKSCHISTIKNGGKCYGNNTTGCLGVTVQDGGICFANEPGACKSWSDSYPTTYTGTGCCDGEYCEAGAPKCYCDIDPNTGKHLTSC